MAVAPAQHRHGNVAGTETPRGGVVLKMKIFTVDLTGNRLEE